MGLCRGQSDPDPMLGHGRILSPGTIGPPGGPDVWAAPEAARRDSPLHVETLVGEQAHHLH